LTIHVHEAEKLSLGQIQAFLDASETIGSGSASFPQAESDFLSRREKMAYDLVETKAE
jgi:hypothetical protein